MGYDEIGEGDGPAHDIDGRSFLLKLPRLLPELLDLGRKAVLGGLDAELAVLDALEKLRKKADGLPAGFLRDTGGDNRIHHVTGNELHVPGIAAPILLDTGESEVRKAGHKVLRQNGAFPGGHPPRGRQIGIRGDLKVELALELHVGIPDRLRLAADEFPVLTGLLELRPDRSIFPVITPGDKLIRPPAAILHVIGPDNDIIKFAAPLPEVTVKGHDPALKVLLLARNLLDLPVNDEPGLDLRVGYQVELKLLRGDVGQVHGLPLLVIEDAVDAARLLVILLEEDGVDGIPRVGDDHEDIVLEVSLPPDASDDLDPRRRVPVKLGKVKDDGIPVEVHTLAHRGRTDKDFHLVLGIVERVPDFRSLLAGRGPLDLADHPGRNPEGLEIRDQPGKESLPRRHIDYLPPLGHRLPDTVGGVAHEPELRRGGDETCLVGNSRVRIIRRIEEGGGKQCFPHVPHGNKSSRGPLVCGRHAVFLEIGHDFLDVAHRILDEQA